ncbi:MAG: hypothetical protein GWP59_05160, partial [Chlamydiales bacterium]|nr:hypothetical protein [Chlamydiales bacterium]
MGLSQNSNGTNSIDTIDEIEVVYILPVKLAGPEELDLKITIGQSGMLFEDFGQFSEEEIATIKERVRQSLDNEDENFEHLSTHKDWEEALDLKFDGAISKLKQYKQLTQAHSESYSRIDEIQKSYKEALTLLSKLALEEGDIEALESKLSTATAVLKDYAWLTKEEFQNELLQDLSAAFSEDKSTGLKDEDEIIDVSDISFDLVGELPKVTQELSSFLEMINQRFDSEEETDDRILENLNEIFTSQNGSYRLNH